jgi:hypothetical protein
MAPKIAPESPIYKVKDLKEGATVVNLLGTQNCDKPTGASSHIAHWRRVTGHTHHPCSAYGCRKEGTTGSHVKVASSVAEAALKKTWYIVPACNEHNKGLSCKCYRVKAHTLAVETPVSLSQRLASWQGDFKKAALAVQGKKR